jgi:transcriptional regulator with XRE-family HTH domain
MVKSIHPEQASGMADDLNRRIGALIYTARTSAGLTQAELAERIGKHEDSISNIERGTVLLTIRTLLDLADAFGVSVQELLPAKASPARVSKNRLKLEAEIRVLLRDLPEKRLELARDQLALIARVD